VRARRAAADAHPLGHACHADYAEIVPTQ
jgi:hypothetical protein